jgi:hypothetical protein
MCLSVRGIFSVVWGYELDFLSRCAVLGGVPFVNVSVSFSIVFWKYPVVFLFSICCCCFLVYGCVIFNCTFYLYICRIICR